MAPARMMEFIDNHVNECPICLAEENLGVEVEKIREFVLPESKIPKAVREQQHKPTPEISPEEDDDVDSEDESDTNEGESEGEGENLSPNEIP